MRPKSQLEHCQSVVDIFCHPGITLNKSKNTIKRRGKKTTACKVTISRKKNKNTSVG